MITITSDFECGAGKKLTRLGDDHWRVEASGDPSGYDKYFCLRIAAGPDDPPSELRLDVHPDSELGQKGADFFRSHFPSNIWWCEGDWMSWVPLRNRWEDSVRFHHDFVELRIPMVPDQKLYVATNPPRRHSDVLAWMATLGERHGGRVQTGFLGKSAERRDIPLLRIPGSRAGLPKLLVLAGQHPSEHCGNWAAEGIAEFALSPIREARELTENFDLPIIPMINPDGNVQGLSGSNAQGVNMVSDFEGATDGSRPKATENRVLWDWLCAEFVPDVILHFHGYMGWRGGAQHRYDGTYLLEDAHELYTQPGRLAAYEAVRSRMTFETHAYSSGWNSGTLDESTLSYQLAAKSGTISAFYEINSASVSAFEQFRRGPQVLSAVVRALVRDTQPFD